MCSSRSRARTTFDIFMSFDGRLDHTKQRWKARAASCTTAVRGPLSRIKLTLTCEASGARGAEWRGPLPDAVFGLRVLRSNLLDDNLVGRARQRRRR